MKKVIVFSKNEIFDLNKRDIDGYCINQMGLYNDNLLALFVKVFRRIKPFTGLSLGNWKKKNGYDIAIIQESDLTPNVLKWFIKNPVADNQIIYFGNAVSEQNKWLLYKAKESNLDIVTYNLADSEKYNLRYNCQSWDKFLIPKEKKAILYDVYFIGKNKGRIEILNNLKRIFKDSNINSRITIIPDDGKCIPYSKCIEETTQCRAILDIVTESNWGLTLRPIEAMFLRKKLITNFTDIEKYEFCGQNRDNIFILGVDDNSKLCDFVNTPYFENDIDLEYYDIASWIKRF